MYECALRASEPGRLRLSYAQDLHETGRLFVWRGKSSVSGHVDLSATCKKALFDWLRHRYPDPDKREKEDFIFPSSMVRGYVKGLPRRTVYDIINRLATRADLPPEVRHPHVLKHSRVQHLLEAASADPNLDPMNMLQTIAQLVGHAAAMTTVQHYMTRTSKELAFVKEMTEELVK
jgi:integrase